MNLAHRVRLRGNANECRGPQQFGPSDRPNLHREQAALQRPGVMLVTLSMKRLVATSVSLTERSRLTETRCAPSCENDVPITQSE